MQIPHCAATVTDLLEHTEQFFKQELVRRSQAKPEVRSSSVSRTNRDNPEQELRLMSFNLNFRSVEIFLLMTKIMKNNRLVTTLFLVCVFATSASAGFLLWPTSKTTKTDTPTSLESLASANTTNDVFDSNTINPTDYTIPEETEISITSTTTLNTNPTSTTSTYSLTETNTNTLKARMLVSDKKYTLKFNDGDTLINAVDKLTLASDQPFLYTSKEYAGMGVMIQSINGIKNNPQTNEYWIYYINGASAKIGISNYKLKSGDLIEWKFTTSTM